MRVIRRREQALLFEQMQPSLPYCDLRQRKQMGGLKEIVCHKMAERTGLEPATPGVTGRYSNQLNYRSKVDAANAAIFRPNSMKSWWVVTGSNRRPSACKADALPAELTTPSREGAL